MSAGTCWKKIHIQYMKKIKFTLPIGILLFIIHPGYAQSVAKYYKVEARNNAQDSVWKTYESKTIDRLPGFDGRREPALNSFGSWKIEKGRASGFFLNDCESLRRRRYTP